jgi:penicillin-binding protein 2
MLIVDQLRRGDPPLRFLALGVLLGLGVLALGLFYVQVLSARRFKESQVSQSFRTVRMPAIRGRVLDNQSVPLADNRPVYTVNLYLEELRPGFQTAYSQAIRGLKLSVAERAALGRQTRYAVVSNLIQQVAAVLRQPVELSPDKFREHYEQRLALPLPVCSDLSPEQVARFVEQAAGLPGLELEVQPVRSYPHGPTAAHVLGYLRRNDRPEEEDLLTRYSLPDYAGAAGIEAVFDLSLRGRPGVKSVLVNNLGYRQSENTWVTSEPGQDVHLTLNLELQRAAEAALRSGGNAVRGAIVLMDVHSGDLLAMVSSPAIEPGRFIPRLRPQDWAAYQDEVLLPLVNRATAGAYMPGSIFKIVVSLAALQAGILDPARVYHSPGYYQLGKSGRGRIIRDTANGGQPTSFDFRRAFKLSSNAYFIHYGLLTGLDDLVALGERLHLGEKTGIPVGQESPGIFPTAEWRDHELEGHWFEGDTANLSIGQGKIAVTPIQMAVMTAAVANGGKVLWPRLVARVEPQDPGRRHEGINLASGRVRNELGIAAAHLRRVRDAMVADTEDEDGTGNRARIEGFKMGAKTGTAQVDRFNPRRKDHITWFVSFAPAEQPTHALVVMIESGVSGGETCAPIARQVWLAVRNQRSVATASLATLR